MLEVSWITAILQLYSQVTDLFGNVIVKHINIRLFDLLAHCHYILNPSRSTIPLLPESEISSQYPSSVVCVGPRRKRQRQGLS